MYGLCNANQFLWETIIAACKCICEITVTGVRLHSSQDTHNLFGTSEWQPAKTGGSIALRHRETSVIRSTWGQSSTTQGLEITNDSHTNDTRCNFKWK
ncbi:hypothetical protein KL933_003096 [Ogataea haglerorum]|uniref:Uncharacterized protein n=1 Tax=Ogataea haglerorum TaxID=1937702 RepID=A0AAN6I002_9ASCO|nr:uncharacterized protein KL911_000657 [Ogataea haglerorum]KAG7693461.1 hypothetical protein KL951_004482 [Ogataea haglerorum]KAG7701073.1 hypothetical protein KL915_000104 [Ogataea haglerorum]KAG7706021.1 hypothetical protein KL950_003597 [Ogataea haglerorum]KAG7709031.1 hypothetical protein KL914_001421 [Ogataea haglerorum]KAG7715159.1 hypothetical protein KL913_003991 [Ogataea haglerorum]